LCRVCASLEPLLESLLFLSVRCKKPSLMRGLSPTLRLVVALTASLLIGGLVCAELPELVLLIDDHSNDFTTVKTWTSGSTGTIAIAEAVSLKGVKQTPGLPDDCPIPQTELEPGSSELFIINATLRI